MSIDIHKLQFNLDALASRLKGQASQRRNRLQQAIRQMGYLNGQVINEKRMRGKFAWPIPTFPSNPTSHYATMLPPQDYSVLATDGSRIDIDDELPVKCALLNISKVLLNYGFTPNAELSSESQFFTEDDQLFFTDTSSTRSQILDKPLLGLKSSVEELVSLAELAENSNSKVPTLALVDGSLILWGQTIQAYPDYISQILINETFLPALDKLKKITSSRPLILAGYISLPASTGVADGLRLSICPYEPVSCDYHCGHLERGKRECDSIGGFLDRDLFSHILQPGQRSDLFVSTSSIVREYYGGHAISFYYLNTGEEIARIEVPKWIAENENLLNLSHSLILDQCEKGLGYPVALMEAHEQAVIPQHDRELFRQMIEETLEKEHVSVYTSQKTRSKKLRSL
jgi:hypothetical protein